MTDFHSKWDANANVISDSWSSFSQTKKGAKFGIVASPCVTSAAAMHSSFRATRKKNRLEKRCPLPNLTFLLFFKNQPSRSRGDRLCVLVNPSSVAVLQEVHHTNDLPACHWCSKRACFSTRPRLRTSKAWPATQHFAVPCKHLKNKTNITLIP